MPEEFNKILKYSEGQEFTIMSFLIFAGTDSLYEKIHTCENNPENPFTTKVSIHTARGYSIFTDQPKINISTTWKNMIFFNIYYMKNFCRDLKEHLKK